MTALALFCPALRLPAGNRDGYNPAMTNEPMGTVTTRGDDPGTVFAWEEMTNAAGGKRLVHPFVLGLMILFGVILPAVTLAIEMVTHMCAEAFFDPIPTMWHALLVAIVPLTNAVALWAAFRWRGRTARWLWLANGFVLGLGLYYAVLFLPLTPIAVVAIIFFGWGLLPLTPLLSLLVTWRARFLLRRQLASGTTGPRSWWCLFVAGFIGFGILSVPQWVTRALTQLAVSEDAATAARGVRLLRVFGHQETLLRDCYRGTERTGFNLLESIPELRAVELSKARQVFYRTTGRVFSSVQPPQKRYRDTRWDDFEWDDAVGGEAVAGMVRGLSLRESRLDAGCDPDQAWGYIEWIMEFENSSTMQREARAQIGLPPGSVVSRVTLWINGEEREAAFGGWAQTRRAYQEVAVAQRRDPLLVTTSGPDRVLVQCFPIPPHGTMKIRLGLTVPLLLNSPDQAFLQWPCFLERNYKVPANLTHAIWLKSAQPPVSLPKQFKLSGRDLRAELPDAALGNGSAGITLRRDPAARQLVGALKDTVIRQDLEPATNLLPARVICVVDGSELLAPAAAEIADALVTLAGNTDLKILLAHDEVDPAGAITPAQLRQRKFRGGHDNLPALLRACDLASESPGSVVLWIHAPQPVLLSSVERLLQFFERTEPDRRPALWLLPVTPGPNLITEKLDPHASVRTLPNVGVIGERIRNIGAPAFVARRGQSTAAVDTATASTSAGASHVVRLWAKEEIERLIRRRLHDQARALAVAHQLVTPVSGAVVLETAEQYKRHDLKPADPASVPEVGLVPEPATALLVGIGLLVVVASARRSRRLATHQYRLTSS